MENIAYLSFVSVELLTYRNNVCNTLAEFDVKIFMTVLTILAIRVSWFRIKSFHC